MAKISKIRRDAIRAAAEVERLRDQNAELRAEVRRLKLALKKVES